MLATMTEDIVYEDSAWPRPMRGHAEVREFLDSSWRASPDPRFGGVDDLILLHPSRPLAASYWRGYGTNTGPIIPRDLRRRRLLAYSRLPSARERLYSPRSPLTVSVAPLTVSLTVS